VNHGFQDLPRSLHAPDWPPCEIYQAYESAREEAESALADWRSAPTSAWRDAFTRYRAAADREDAAALAWLRSCAAYDRAHGLVADGSHKLSSNC
jgi:hypothetical protein